MRSEEINKRKPPKERRVEDAGMVKLVDTPGLGPGALCHAGSSPAARKSGFFCVWQIVSLVDLFYKQDVLSLMFHLFLA